MNTPFPVPELAIYPTRITPCPIWESIMEVRFVTEVDWTYLPGPFWNLIKTEFPEQQKLPILNIPPDIRESDGRLKYKPLLRFHGDQFSIQLGPRVVSLLTKPNSYPGWAVIKPKLRWFINIIEKAGFILEGERIGLRYVDFFEGDLFDQLKLKLTVDGHSATRGETEYSSVFTLEGFTARIHVNNKASISKQGEILKGSVFDLDLWLGAASFNLFEDGLEKFDKAHDFNKKIFFGLLEPEYLKSLSPEY